MLRSILIKEFKEIHRERRVRTLLIAFGVMLIAMLVSSYTQWQNGQERRQDATTADRELWLGQDEKNPHDAAHYGMVVFRPDSSLSVIDPGINEYIGKSVFLEAHRRNESQNAAILDASGLARFGVLSPQFLVLSIFPLFLLLVGFDAFTRERESETLPMLTVNGLSPWRFAFGKFVAQCILCGLMILPIAALGAGLTVFMDDGLNLLRSMLLLLAVYLIFLMAFSALVLTVSLWSPSSKISLVVLLGIWFVMTMALPRLTTNVAEEHYPYPTYTQFQAEVKDMKAKGIDGHDPKSAAAEAFKQETLAAHGVDKVEDLPFNFRGLLAQKGEEFESSVYAAQYDKVKNQYQQQVALFLRASLLSPYLAARFTSMALCRSDDPAFWHFSDAAETYRLEFNRVLNMDNAENSTYGERGYRASRDLWAKVPAFDYQHPSLGGVLPRIKPFLLTLILQFAGLLGLLFWSASLRGHTRY